MKKKNQVDTVFLGLVIALMIFGVIMFVSASLGVLAKNESKFWGVLFNQLFLGVGLGTVALYTCLRIPYTFWRKYAFYILIASLVLTALVYVPGLGFSHGGARRWISIGPISFQPVEFLKIAFIIYFAGWLAWVKDKVEDFRYGMIPLFVLMGLIAGILFPQPDTKSFILMLVAGLSMLLISGVPWKYLGMLAVFGVVALTALVFMKPYLMDRVKTYIDPSRDPRGASYQLRQSLIAVGSGGVFGRGLGQSIQKFEYLPEPQGDSIFAVVGEEFGFVGATLMIMLFVAFALRGLRIASRAPDLFGRLLVTGIVILLISQSFLNIGAIIGVLPLTGVPLVFVSHGGTALMISLGAVGILLNVSKNQKQIS